MSDYRTRELIRNLESEERRLAFLNARCRRGVDVQDVDDLLEQLERTRLARRDVLIAQLEGRCPVLPPLPPPVQPRQQMSEAEAKSILAATAVAAVGVGIFGAVAYLFGE